MNEAFNQEALGTHLKQDGLIEALREGRAGDRELELHALPHPQARLLTNILVSVADGHPLSADLALDHDVAHIGRQLQEKWRCYWLKLRYASGISRAVYCFDRSCRS